MDVHDILRRISATGTDSKSQITQSILEQVNRTWNVDLGTPTRGLGGTKGIALWYIKRLVRKVAGWYITPLVIKQREFNASAARAINQLAAYQNANNKCCRSGAYLAQHIGEMLGALVTDRQSSILVIELNTRCISRLLHSQGYRVICASPDHYYLSELSSDGIATISNIELLWTEAVPEYACIIISLTRQCATEVNDLICDAIGKLKDTGRALIVDISNDRLAWLADSCGLEISLSPVCDGRVVGVGRK